MKRIESFFFVVALASAIWVSACGDDERPEGPRNPTKSTETGACADYCAAKEQECGDDLDECLEKCREADPPKEFLDCSLALDCWPDTDEERECRRLLTPSADCVAGCEKMTACLGADEEWTHTCATFCTWEYSKEEQECYGAMDDECGVPEGCDDVVHGG
jgi:hypothetical protein